MQFLGSFESGHATVVTLQSIRGQKNLTLENCVEISIQLINTIQFLHGISILHNDIKANNVILFKDNVKIIDFGKATHVKQPLLYNLNDKSKELYNQRHRYFAHELRNVRGTSQNIMTDTYSVGYLMKYIGYYELLSDIYEIGRQMKEISLTDRLSLSAGVNALNGLIIDKKLF